MLSTEIIVLIAVVTAALLAVFVWISRRELRKGAQKSGAPDTPGEIPAPGRTHPEPHGERRHVPR